MSEHQNNSILFEPPQVAESFKRHGISLFRISRDQISMVNDRDFQGLYEAISVGPIDRELIGIKVGEHIVGYSVIGYEEKEGKLYGEITMMYISPKMEGIGLGSLMNVISRQRMMQRNPDVLYTEVGDDSGKIIHILEEQGFTNTGTKSKGAGQHAIWQLEFHDQAEKNAFKKKLDILLDEKLAKLKPNDELISRANQVDYDSPKNVNIEEVVRSRLPKLKLSKKDQINIFGYYGNPVRISLVFVPDVYSDKLLMPEEKAAQKGKYRVILTLLGAQQNQLEETLQLSYPGKKYSFWPRTGYYTGISVGSELMEHRDAIEQELNILSQFAERMK